MKKAMDRNNKILDIILEEALDKHVKDVADKELDFEMTDEEIRIMESKEQIIYKKLMKEINTGKKKTFSVKKVCVLVAVFVVAIAAVSIGTSALHEWWQRTNMSMLGTDLNVDTENLTFEDYRNIRNFKNKSEIIVPNWLPEGMELTKIKDEDEAVDLCYNKDIVWIIVTTKTGVSSGNLKIDTENNEYTTENTEILGMECRIVKITSEIGYATYSAYWNSGSTSYILMTNVSEEDFNKILKNLKYFEE